MLCYYSLTTMSTVGYGDHTPVTELEMLMTIFIQLAGIGIFAWFMDVISARSQDLNDSLGVIDCKDELF